MKRFFLFITVMIIFVMTLTACGRDQKSTESSLIDQKESAKLKISDKTVVATDFPSSGIERSNIESESTNETNITAWIVASNVNLRYKASKKAKILDLLSYGQEVILLNITREWALVSVNGVEGYVFAEFLSKEKVAPTTTAKPPKNNQNITVAIDAGHQAKGNNSTEPIGPDASEKKAKVTSGTSGVSTKIPEYKLNLKVSKKLRDKLSMRGYHVVMIREKHDVNISNKERAQIASQAGADIFVRIHADGSENQNINGILTMCPSRKNPYIPHLFKESHLLSEEIVNAMVATTGSKNRGVLEVDNMSGINWSTMPVTIVEMGLMTNPAEDKLMQTNDYQEKLAMGIADGIDRFFEKKKDNR